MIDTTTGSSRPEKTKEPNKGYRQTKASKVEALLARKRGATIDQICNATGWQAHTCRACLSGLRKKGHELVRNTSKRGKSVYRLTTINSLAKAD